MADDAHSDRYDQTYYEGNGQLGDRPALTFYARLVQRYCPPGPALDFGCGTGHLLRRLAAARAADGLEVSDFSADQAGSQSPGSRIFRSMDDLPDRAYAAVSCIHVVEHLPDDLLARVYATWRRVLRPGGRVLVVTPVTSGRAHRMRGESWMAYTDPTHINLKPHADWLADFAAHGLAAVRDGSDGLWDFPYSPRLPWLVDAAVHGWGAAAQLATGRLLLRPDAGESGIFVLAATDDE